MGNHKAGMCANPFGGHERLDKCNLQGPSMLGGELVDILSDVPGERTLIAETFKDALNNYLFFGLGQNGTSAPEFWYGVEFLFRIRASRPETWKDARYMRDAYVDEQTGKRVSRTLVLTDSQLQAGCADYLWDLLEMPLSLDEFVIRVRAVRRDLLRENKEQIEKVIRLLNSPSLSRNVLPGDTYPMKLFGQDYQEVLLEPKDPDDVSELVHYYPRTKTKCPLRVSAAPRHRAARIAAGERRVAPPKGELF
jgi:hypothetical protein